jgi:hypothetical protein
MYFYSIFVSSSSNNKLDIKLILPTIAVQLRNSFVDLGGGEAAAAGGRRRVLEGGAGQQARPAQGGDRGGQYVFFMRFSQWPPDWRPLAEDTATKLKRGQLNVCIV